MIRQRPKQNDTKSYQPGFYSYISQAASVFYKSATFKKQANIKNDMVLRILYWLGPSLINETSNLSSSEKYYKLLNYHLEYGKYLLESATRTAGLATKACVNELSHYSVREIYGEAQEAYRTKRYGRALSICIPAFQDWPDHWPDTNYGGPNWAKIGQTALEILNNVENATTLRTILQRPKLSTTQKAALLEQLKDAYSEVSIYLNTLDGLVHNTGGIMEKMIAIEDKQEEFSSQGKSYIELQYLSEKKRYDIYRLLDAKELKALEHTLNVMLPTILGTIPAAHPMRELLKEYLFTNKNKVLEVRPQIISAQLEAISRMKDIISRLTTRIKDTGIGLESAGDDIRDSKTFNFIRLLNSAIGDFVENLENSEDRKNIKQIVQTIRSKYDLESLYNSISTHHFETNSDKTDFIMYLRNNYNNKEIRLSAGTMTWVQRVMGMFNSDSYVMTWVNGQPTFRTPVQIVSSSFTNSAGDIDFIAAKEYLEGLPIVDIDYTEIKNPQSRTEATQNIQTFIKAINEIKNKIYEYAYSLPHLAIEKEEGSVQRDDLKNKLKDEITQEITIRITQDPVVGSILSPRNYMFVMKYAVERAAELLGEQWDVSRAKEYVNVIFDEMKVRIQERSRIAA